MLFQLKILNSDALLNNFQELGILRLVNGSSGKLMCQLFQSDKKIRYVPLTGATFSLTLQKSDNTTVTYTGSNPFALDTSIIAFDIPASDSSSIISQNVNVLVTEGMNTSYAILQNGLQMIPLTQGC